MACDAAPSVATSRKKTTGRGAEQIWKDRDAKLETAREQRQEKRAAQKNMQLLGDPACN